MAFMELQIYRKGAVYTADCAQCYATIYTHEWVDDDHNERRDAMQAGTCACDQCFTGRANPKTFSGPMRMYAGRYSAPGYLDCTEWMYDTNKRRLERELRAIYGE